MFVTGLIRIYVGTHLNKDVRTIVVLAGVVTSLVGLVVLIGWPANSLAILGVLLGLDLLFWGGSWITLGLRTESTSSRPPAPRAKPEEHFAGARAALWHRPRRATDGLSIRGP